jgi:hypothetical protein
VAHLVFFSAVLAFLSNMSEKRKFSSLSAIQVKNRRKTICIEEKLCVIMRSEKGKRIVDICRNVRLAHGIVHKIRDNVYRIKESAKSRTKVFVCVARLRPSYPNEPYQKLWMRVFYIFTVLEIKTILYRNVCIRYRHEYIMHILDIYILEVHVSTSGIVIHYIGRGCQSPNHQEIHCFNWEFYI